MTSTARAAVAAAFCTVLGAGCASSEATLRQHREKLASISATATMVADAWLSGAVSGAYAIAAFDEAFQLSEQERQALSTIPQAFLDERGPRLPALAERLSESLQMMDADVAAGNASALRTHRRAVPDMPSAP